MLKYYYGCMYAGKTAYIVNTYMNYCYKKLDPIIIKPIIDNREGEQQGWGTTASRLMPNKKVPCYYFKDLREELPKLNFKTIIVDEAQFLSRDDVMYLADIVNEQKVNVLAYGLKTDINGNLFEGSAALLAVAKEIKEIESLCQAPNCQEKAQMHARYINGKRVQGDSIAIEKDDVVYKSYCYKHWREL